MTDSRPSRPRRRLVAATTATAGAAVALAGLVSAGDLFTAVWGGAALALLDAFARALAASPARNSQPPNADGPESGHDG